MRIVIENVRRECEVHQHFYTRLAGCVTPAVFVVSVLFLFHVDFLSVRQTSFLL